MQKVSVEQVALWQNMSEDAFQRLRDTADGAGVREVEARQAKKAAEKGKS